MYSQNNEDTKIYRYFEQHPPKYKRLLDIGANDGITLSNSRLFIERGWYANLVEPSPAAFRKLSSCKLTSKNGFSLPYSQYPHEIGLHNFAITDTTGEIDFFESDWHLTHNDTALLSTSNTSHMEKWKHHRKPDGSVQEFMRCTVTSYRWEDCPLFGRGYDYITIDTEGMNWLVLAQIPLHGVQCLCVEWGNDQSELTNMTYYAARYGMKEISRNFENVIFTR